jgi:hypothetical protein
VLLKWHTKEKRDMANIKTAEDYRKYQRTVELFREEFKLSHLSTGEENHFSWDRCDCCQDRNSGERYVLLARQEGNSEVVEFSVCVDCVYYINYGRLDDATMLAIGGAA